MGRYALFCIAEEAKKFTRKVVEYTEADRLLHLITSRLPTKQSEEPKVDFNKDESFDTDFIGASNEDCQNWALDIGKPLQHIENFLIVIVDARSVDDGTVLIQQYAIDEETTVYEKYGPLPPQLLTWYEWRVRYQDIYLATVSLGFGDIGNVTQVYFGLKTELLDERGVFDVEEAEKIVGGKDPSKIGGIVDWALVHANL